MTTRRFIMLVGAVVLVAGVIGLLVPVSVSHNGEKSVGCGTGLVADMSAAQAANDKDLANLPIINQVVPHIDYLAECHTSVNSRRAWSIPLVVIGAVAAAGALLVRPKRPSG